MKFSQRNERPLVANAYIPTETRGRGVLAHSKGGGGIFGFLPIFGDYCPD